MLPLKKNFWEICLVLILLLAAYLRFPLLNEYPMDRDELARVVPDFTFTSIIPPGIFFLTKLSASLFNYEDFGFRLPSFIFGLGGIFFVFLLGKEFFGKLTGVISALVLSLLLTHIGYSNQAKEYVPVMAFASLSSILAYRIIFFPAQKISFLYAVVSFLGLFFSSYFYLAVIVYQIIIIVLMKTIRGFKNGSLKSRLNFQTLLAIFFTALLSLFLAIIAFNKINDYFGVFFIKPDPLFLQRYWQEIGYFVTQDVEFAKITDLLFLMGLIILPFASRFRRGAIYILLFLILDSLLVATVRFKHSAFPLYYIRYHSFLLPLYLIVVVGMIEGLVYLLKKTGKTEVAWVVVGFFLLFVVKRSYPIIKWYYTVPQMATTNFKDAGRYLNNHLDKVDTLVRLKNFGMDHKFNHVNHYLDRQVLKNINYSIFPERTAKNNWYVSLGPGDEDELGFSDYLYIERIKPSLRYPAPVISKLKYYGPFLKTRKLENKDNWRLSVSSGQSSARLVVDENIETFWDGPEDSKTITVDLSKEFVLNSLRFNFSQPYPQKFTLWLSEDGFNKQSFSANKLAEARFSANKKEMFNFRDLNLDPPNSQIFFPPTKARFVLIELKGSGIREINAWEVYEKKIEGVDKNEVVDNGLPGIQIKDEESPNGFIQFIPYDKDVDYTFFQIGNKLQLKKGKYRLKFKIKVDKIVANWQNNLLTAPVYRLYEYLEPRDTSQSDILYVSVETTRGTFYNSPTYLNVRGEVFKEVNKYYDFSLNFTTDGKETLSIQAFNPKHRRYPANLYITYPEVEKLK